MTFFYLCVIFVAGQKIDAILSKNDDKKERKLVLEKNIEK